MHKSNKHGSYRHVALCVLAFGAGCGSPPTSPSQVGLSEEPEVVALSVKSRSSEDKRISAAMLDAIIEHADLVKKWNHESDTVQTMGAIEFALIPTELMKRGDSGKIALLCLGNTGSASAAENLLAARAKSIVELGPTGVLIALSSPSRHELKEDIGRLYADLATPLQGVAKEAIRLYPEKEAEVRWLIKVD